MWPWNVAFGQIGTKASPLTTRAPGVAVPPDMSQALRQEAQCAKALANASQPCGVSVQQALEDRQQLGACELFKTIIDKFIYKWHGG